MKLLAPLAMALGLATNSSLLSTEKLTNGSRGVADSPEPSKEAAKTLRSALVGSTWLKENNDELFAFDGMAVISNFRGDPGTWKVIGTKTIIAQMNGFYAITFDSTFQNALLFGKDGLIMKIHRDKSPAN